MQVKKQHLELDTEQQTGSKLGKEHIKAVYWRAEVALKGSLLVSNFLLALTKETGGMRVLSFQFPP